MLMISQLKLKWIGTFSFLFLSSWGYAEAVYWDDFPSFRYYSNSGRHSSNQIISIDMDPQSLLNSSFRMAARENRIRDIQKFLTQGAEINSQTSSGETALMVTSRNCSNRAVDMLIERGAGVNVKDFDGRTALMFASMESCVKAVEILLKVPGIDLDAIDEAKKTALDYAQESALLEVGGPAEKIIHLILQAKKHQASVAKYPRKTAMLTN